MSIERIKKALRRAERDLRSEDLATDTHPRDVEELMDDGLYSDADDALYEIVVELESKEEQLHSIRDYLETAQEYLMELAQSKQEDEVDEPEVQRRRKTAIHPDLEDLLG